MYFDFKITTWERVRVPEEYEEEILQAIKDEKITSSNDLYLYIIESPDYNVTMEPHYESPLADTTEQMTLEQNNFASTIEVLDDDNGETIWENGN